MRFRRVSFVFVAALTLAATATAQYPSGTVTVVVSGPAGGPLDVVTRAVFERVRERMGSQPIVIDNKPGGGGIVAVTAVTRSQADGHTLLSTIDPPIVATPALVKSVPYDAMKDLVPVAMLGDGGDNVLVVPATSTAKSVQELVATLRANPDQANYSSSGNGGPGHLLGELFNRQANVKAVHIPHKGAPDALNALLAGRVSFGFIPVGLALPQIEAGKVRATRGRCQGTQPADARPADGCRGRRQGFQSSALVDHRLRAGEHAESRRTEAQRGDPACDAFAGSHRAAPKAGVATVAGRA